MVRIGVTGGIGVGKSCVSRFWSSYFKLPRIDADEVCKALLAEGESGYEVFKKKFGKHFLLQNGQIDRIRLREVLFADFLFRNEVNKLIHPLALQQIRREYIQLHDEYVIIEVPLLFEAGWEKEFEHIVVVYAEKKVCAERVMTRDKVARIDAVSTIESQISVDSKVMSADHVINNNSFWLNTCLEIIHLGNVLTEMQNFSS